MTDTKQKIQEAIENQHGIRMFREDFANIGMKALCMRILSELHDMGFSYQVTTTDDLWTAWIPSETEGLMIFIRVLDYDEREWRDSRESGA